MAKSASKSDGYWETLKTVFWALLIAAAFRSVLFQPFSIPSGSMKPTLLVGDYLFVSKFSYGYSRYSFPFAPSFIEGRIWGRMPERGDVAVFKHPRHDACADDPVTATVNFVRSVLGVLRPAESDCVDYVKRIVGLPGDRVQVIGGVLHINGQALPTVRDGVFVEVKALRGSPPRPPLCQNEPLALGEAGCVKERWVETLPNGRSHAVLNVHGTVGEATSGSLRNADNTQEFAVPADHVFVMGDNRDNSVDSRFADVGPVPIENLIGRADVVAVSTDGAFWEIWKWRFDRFFKAIE